MQTITTRELKERLSELQGQEVSLQGWIRSHRKQKEIGFIDFYDGTCFKNPQVVYDNGIANFQEISALHNGAAISVTGEVVPSYKDPETPEIKAHTITLEGDCPEDYPLQPKRHSVEFLREIAYLRPRTRLFQAVFRVRSVASMAIHTYFQDRGYVYVHTPLITANDAEGAGNTFTVTTLPQGVKADPSEDFFGKATSLAVTGQLEGETFAMAFSRIYTFGPTFRAENSNTKTHAAEFWMIEPEIAFCDIHQLMDIEEDFLKYLVKTVLEKCPDELAFLDKFTGGGLLDKLNSLAESRCARITHDEAITILREANRDGRFQFEPKYGEDTAKEHEKYLTEEYFHGPVFVYDWPKDIKAFYMYQNDDGKTVAAVDLLVPGSGELMGGSQREDRYDRLCARMDELGISKEQMDWYVNLRRFGGCTHAGFGMGFERLLMYLTGVDNIRDVIPYPRTPRECEF
ncbi:MAG: asparagine--tRNA ligase [Clostridia bacterium]|nr:asparagine--tRNA ligase [Clostridia bacterium]MBR4459085.1 asparagine--tRNA ligase [Clostridia bacterium]